MATRKGSVEANGTELYHEIRGTGPTVLFISGATGDAGHFERTAEALADSFTVVTYDRRGNSRSAAPADWTTTSMDEQADDAAALIRALGIGPAAVFGTSGGAVILLNLLLRHPEVVRGAIVHEPPMIGVLDQRDAIGAELQAQVETGLAAVGPRGTLEGFIRVNAGDDAFERMDPAMRERMLGNAGTFFGAELEAFVSWVPDDADLAGVRVPAFVTAGVENRGVYYYDASAWVAEALGTELIEIPGAHAPYMLHGEQFGEALRPLLDKLV